MIAARIVIERELTEDGDALDNVSTEGIGGDLSLVEALGMLRLAEDTVIRTAMGEGD